MAVPILIIDGDVVAVHSYWNDDRSAIATDATVRTADGSEVVVNQVGGSVDGIGMTTFPAPAILEVGMHVAVAAHKDVDLSQHEHVVLDSVRVLSYPAGYVRTGPTKAGHPLRWASGCAFVTVDDAGTTAIDGDGEFPVIQAAIDEWNTKTASCSSFTLINAGRKSLEVGNDKVNLIKFRDLPHMCTDGTTSWGERPATKTTPASCYSRQAAGLTTAVYVDDMTSARDGEILDADIELNGVNFAISVNHVSKSEQACQAELQNTLTHELGHLHGLEHPCTVGNDPARTDNLGNPVPACSASNPPKILEATMYNFQECGETKKESLSDDDIQSMCDIYPKTSNPGTCEPVGKTTGGGCCSASGDGRGDLSLLLGGTTMLLLMRRRKVSRSA
ncbi:MAG TPA: hypothetical protein VGD37_14530 [Kofleriaceae bacterium]|jgi:hypothetical protein